LQGRGYDFRIIGLPCYTMMKKVAVRAPRFLDDPAGVNVLQLGGPGAHNSRRASEAKRYRLREALVLALSSPMKASFDRTPLNSYSGL
jgi:hypothetical protein